MAGNMLRLIVSFASIDKLSGPLKKIVGLAQSGSERLAGMKRNARDLDRELKSVQAQIAGTSGNVTGLLEKEKALQSQIARSNAEMAKQTRLLKIENIANRMSARGESLKSAGQSNMFGGAMMATPLIFAAKQAMDYEKSLALIAQKTDLNAAATRKFGDGIIATANATSQPIANLVEAADWLSGKGVAVKAIEGMLPAIGKFATAWDANVVDSSKAAYAGFLSLKVPITDTGRSLEIMAAAGKAGGFEVKDMAQFFPQLTANMSTFGSKGLSAIADLSAALQVLEAKTGDGAMAATNLDNLMTFVKSARGIRRFKQFGVDVPAALKKARKEGASTIETLVALVNKATKGDTIKIAQVVSNQEAGKAALALVDSYKRYKEIRAEAWDSIGLSEQEYKRLSGTSAANWERLKTALTTLAITAGAKLLPMLVSGVQWLTQMINKVNAWAQANPRAASALMQLVAAAIAFKIGLGALQFVFGSALVNLARFIRLLQATGVLLPILTGLRVAIIALGQGVAAAGAWMLANPVVLIITAIVLALAGAAYLIYRYWDNIKAAFWKGLDMLGQAWNWVKAHFAQVVVTAIFAPIGGFIIAGLVAGFKAAFPKAYDEIAGFLGGLVTRAKKLLGIHSPSRVFMGLGSNIAAGLALGIAQGQGAAAMAAQEMTHRVAMPAMEPIRPARRPAASPAASAGGAGAGAFGPINITINAAPGQSATDIAQEVQRILNGIHQDRAAAKRSSYVDEE